MQDLLRVGVHELQCFQLARKRAPHGEEDAKRLWCVSQRRPEGDVRHRGNGCEMLVQREPGRACVKFRVPGEQGGGDDRRGPQSGRRAGEDSEPGEADGEGLLFSREFPKRHLQMLHHGEPVGGGRIEQEGHGEGMGSRCLPAGR